MVSWQHWFWIFSVIGMKQVCILESFLISLWEKNTSVYKDITVSLLYRYLHHFQLCTILVGKVGVHAAVQDAGRSCHRCSLPLFVTAPSFSQGTQREPAGRDRERALGFLIMLNISWDFKDTAELLGVTWLILPLWKKAQRVIDFKVSLFKLALQPAAFSNREVGVACLPDYPPLMLLINQAQARYNDWRMTHEQSYQLFFFFFLRFYFVEERWEKYKKYN